MMKKLIFMFLFLYPSSLFAQSVFNEPYILMEPQESVILQVYTVNYSAFLYSEGAQRELTEDAKTAISIAPLWIRTQLFDVMIRVDDSMQDYLAKAIIDAENEDIRYVDEVAFSIAHLPLEDILYENGLSEQLFDTEILLENVRTIYESDEILHYVELVEYNPGTENAYTSVILTVNGQQWEVSQNEYYWYIVHPRLGDDSALYINPKDGEPSPKEESGRFWRSFLFSENPSPDYNQSFVLNHPFLVTDLGDFSAAGGIAIGDDTDPVVEVKGPLNEPMLIHYATGKGMVFATTMELETIDNNLLDNLLYAGFGYGAVINTGSNVEFLVIRGRDTFGATLVETRLESLGYNFTVWDSTGLENLTAATELDTYKKIIIPGDQSLDFYSQLESKSTYFETWMANVTAPVFLFFGALDTGHETDDWNNYLMPFGIKRVNTGAHFTGVPGGYPSWREVIALDATASGNDVWDATTHAALSGQRTYTENDTVLDRIGYLTSQTLELRVGEIPPEYAGPEGDCPGCVVRSPYPVRIAYQHYGNCGELQDMNMAYGRLGLIPSAAVGGIPEDHVWNEYYLLDNWLTLQVDWSDGVTRIAVPANAQDKDYNGGKDLSVVYRTRPDGKWENITSRYSKTVTLNFIVKDLQGNPVEGAEVGLASENWYDPTELTYALVTHTGYDGVASVKVGDYQNIYAYVDSAAGTWPESGISWVLCADVGALASTGASCPDTASWDSEMAMPVGNVEDATFNIEITLEDELPAIQNVSLSGIEPDGRKKVKITYNIGTSASKGLHVNTLGSSYTDKVEPEEIPEVYLMDYTNMNRYNYGLDASSIATLTVDGTEHEILLPCCDSYYIVTQKNNSWGISKYMNMEVRVEEYIPPENSDSGCSCNLGGNSNNTLPVGLLIMLTLFGIVKRRRM
jgi:hypothetical protein